jgi:predicted ATPase
MPELLRLKGNVFLTKPLARIDQAEMYLRQSLELSRRQGARLWELRAPTDLAKMMAAQGRREHAHALLEPILASFADSPDTDDLRAAERLLKTSL